MIALVGCDNLWSLQVVPQPVPDVLVADDAVAAMDGIDAPPNVHGCSDATREGFPDLVAFPALAACAGAWSIPGLRPDPPVSCNRAGGDDGARPAGVGCSANDLCATGWHVCRTRLEVYERLPATDRSCALLGAEEGMLFVTAQSGVPGGGCTETGTNDVVGCGTYGIGLTEPTCEPLDRSSDNMCFTIKSVGGWECPDPDSELTTIRKSDPTAGGGVLCCRDSL